MGSMSVSSCRCCSLCLVCLIMLVEDARGDHMEEAYSRGRSLDCLVANHECLFLFAQSCCDEYFFIYRGLCSCTDML